MINEITNTKWDSSRKSLERWDVSFAWKKVVTKHIAFLGFPRPGEHLSRAYFIITTARYERTLAVLQAVVKSVKKRHSPYLCMRMSPSRCILTFVNFRKGLLLSSRFYGEEIKSRAKQASAMKWCVFNDMHFGVEERDLVLIK